MSDVRRAAKPPLLLTCLGAALLAVAAVHHGIELTALDGRLGPLTAAFFDGLLALGFVYAGYWLSGTDLDTREQWTAFAWSVAGAVLFVLVIGVTYLIRILEGRVVAEPVFPLLIAAESGGLAGFVAGYYNARARRDARRARRATDRLEAANSRLEASNERLEQFAYGVSHDLQEPLRMVSSYLELLEGRYADDLDEEAREFIDYAVDGAERMGAMVESMLEYSRVTTGGDPLEPTDADAVLADVLDDLQFRIEETDATVTSEALPTVMADPDQLAQVFRNLLSNALRHSGDAPPRIHVGAERSGNAWQFSVRDEGVGIDPEYQDRIFRLFEQLDAGEESSGTGGFGLALCRRIVERHDGQIRVDSTPGEGSTFSFTLPAADEREEQTLASEPSD